MKTLKESILADMDSVISSGDNNIRDLVKKFLSENYTGSYLIPYSPNKDGLYEISVTKRIAVKNKSIEALTNGLFIFTVCNGDFDCSNCYNLKSLEGAPKKIKGVFICSFCKSLTSLKGGPEHTSGIYYCNDCNLESLEGAPNKLSAINCAGNHRIENLKGLPKKISTPNKKYKAEQCKLVCNNIKGLKTLEGCPEEIQGWFDVSNCPNLDLDSLKKYFPKKIYDDFMCLNNFKDRTEEEIENIKQYLIDKKYILGKEYIYM